MIAIQFAFSMICLTFNSAPSKWVDKSCLVGGCMLGEEHSEISSRNLNTHCLWASEVNELHTQLEQDIHQHFSDYVPPVSQKELLIPGGPRAVAIDEMSDSSFSPWIEVKGLLSEVAWCERWGNFMHLARWFCIFVAFFTYDLAQYLQMYTAIPSTLAAVKCLHIK